MYSGPEYEFHYRYSNVLLSVTMTFLYGGALPILYPIACFNFVFVWIYERILVIFYYREPPSYDETMTLRCILFCRIAAVAGLAVSFWQLGNRQMFDNVLFPITSSRDAQKSGHFVGKSVENLSLNTP